MALRAALKFDPGEASRHIRTGRWGAATPAKKLRALAEENGSRLALDIGGVSFDWDDALERALSLASGLAERGIGARGRGCDRRSVASLLAPGLRGGIAVERGVVPDVGRLGGIDARPVP